MGNGGVFASESTRISRASTSISPVGSLRVHGVRGARRDLADDRDHVLAAHARRPPGVGGRGRLRLGHHLADALAVAQVDEDHAARGRAAWPPSP